MHSIADVAREAGVSVTTVSRVLSNSAHPVKAETRERVMRAAEALHFTPSALARALVSEKSRIIGVIVGDASDPYFATIIRGISDEARAHNYLTVVCNSDRIPAVELNFIRLLRDYRVDGVIFAGGGLTDPDYLAELESILAWLKAQHIPIVTLGQHLFEAPQITIHNRQASQEMTEYLISLGHRRIGFIAGPAVLTTSALRREGYELALRQHGLPVDQGLIIESNFTYEAGLEVAEKFLALAQPPTAIFGSNDIATIGCLTGLRRRGIVVPDQISIAGFDNIAATQYVDPPLTTIDVPMREQGISGMQTLLRLMEQPAAVAARQWMPHTLVVRASTGPAPAAPGQKV